MGLKEKKIMTSFGVMIRVHELSVMDKISIMTQKDVTSWQVCIDEEGRKALNDNPGTKEDISAIIDAIVDINGWNQKKEAVLDPKSEPQQG